MFFIDKTVERREPSIQIANANGKRIERTDKKVHNIQPAKFEGKEKQVWRLLISSTLEANKILRKRQ